MEETRYDIAIIGAGPAGSAAAYFLARAGLKVALLDKTDFPRDKTCGDGLTPRALKVLADLGVLAQVEKAAFRCQDIHLHHSESVEYALSLRDLAGLPNYILVLPRFRLDEILLRHAISAGAVFLPEHKVDDITFGAEGGASIRIDGRAPLACRLPIVATGANTRLLRQLGLLKAAVPSNLAARTYFENVDGLEQSVVLFFDGVNRPGYGWVFPTSPTSANIGCGVFFDDPEPQATRLKHLIQTHPYLRRILKNARQSAPIKGYPLRTDFRPEHGGNERCLVIGESVGLVNPITGEGIDYAMESGQLAAQAILAAWRGGQPGHGTGRRYRAALRQTYSYQLWLNRLAQRIYFRGGALDTLLRRGQKSEYVRRAIVDACFGSADPAILISPRSLWEVFRP
jgi:geranylgeranyl reductase family protein